MLVQRPRRNRENIALAPIETLAVDDGRTFAPNDVVDRAAGMAVRLGMLAGAQELDASAAVAGEVRLDETLASQAASSYLAEHGVDGTVSVADREVTVTAVRYVDYLMLPGGITLDATATSRVTQERAP